MAPAVDETIFRLNQPFSLETDPDPDLSIFFVPPRVEGARLRLGPKICLSANSYVSNFIDSAPVSQMSTQSPQLMHIESRNFDP